MYKDRVCRKCGEIFTPNSGHQSVCERCRMSVCKTCGRVFAITNTNSKSIYCSRECYIVSRWGENRRKEQRVCPVCGKSFESFRDKRTKNRFCCLACRDQWNSLNRRGINHPRYKGRIDYGPDNKYVAVLSPHHPFCDSKGYVLEHRLIVEKHLMRFLEPTEVVHHIDGNTKNNSVENLAVMNKKEHDQHHTNQRWKRGNFR